MKAISIGSTEGPPVIVVDQEDAWQPETSESVARWNQLQRTRRAIRQRDALVSVVQAFLAKYGTTPAAAVDHELAKILVNARAALGEAQS